MYKESWDDISSDYDQSVEDNDDELIVNYLQTEMEIIANLCKDIIKKSNKKCSIIDMGSGTGRVLFSLDKALNDNTVLFYGLDTSEHMIRKANEKAISHTPQNNNMKFLLNDSTDPKSYALFSTDTTNIVLCMYNTIGVIPAEKRTSFFENMIKLAGKNGLVIVEAFNGDEFESVAPMLYTSMKKMVKKTDADSFDNKNKVFQNHLGFRSQWFTQDQIKNLLRTNIESIPISVILDGKSCILGNIFLNRELN